VHNRATRHDWMLRKADENCRRRVEVEVGDQTSGRCCGLVGNERMLSKVSVVVHMATNRSSIAVQWMLRSDGVRWQADRVDVWSSSLVIYL
jgi:hypothetical protein